MQKTYYVYLLASKTNVLYIGVTEDIIKRTYQHKHNLVAGFTQKYNVHKLVYYESFNDIISAITREKQMKKWKKQWKIELVEEHNPEWKDLYEELI